MSRSRPPAPDASASSDPRHGERRRRAILATARDVSTAWGLEGLSIGRLAAEVGMSKSGVAAHFASKQALQLDAVQSAAEGYARHVLDPADALEPGAARVRALLEAWIDYVDGIEYRGGCFFAATGAEFAARPGPVRERVAEYTRTLIRALEREIRTAVRLGELAPDTDIRRLAFQLHGIVQEANLRRTLLDDPGAFDDARALVAQSLAHASAPRARTGDPS